MHRNNKAVKVSGPEWHDYRLPDRDLTLEFSRDQIREGTVQTARQQDIDIDRERCMSHGQGQG